MPEPTQVEAVVSRIPTPWPNGQSPKAPKKAQKAPEPGIDAAQVAPSQQARRVEETGPDLTVKSPDELIIVLSGESKTGKWDAVRAAWELGNRQVYASWIPTADQQKQIDEIVENLIVDANLSSVDYYSTSRDQLYRLWSLAHPALLRALDPARKNLDLIIKTLAATRTNGLIIEMVRQYNDEVNPERKRWLAFTLSCMKEQRRVLTLRRKVMSIDESEKLYAELIAPVLNGKTVMDKNVMESP